MLCARITGALCNACTHLPQTGDRADPRACCKGLEADWARPGRGPFGIQRKALCIRKCSVYCVQDVAAQCKVEFSNWHNPGWGRTPAYIGWEVDTLSPL